MARYYFDFVDDNGGPTIDKRGEEFPDAKAAEKEAFAAIGDVARDLSFKRQPGRIAIQVRDNGNPPFFEVALSIEARLTKRADSSE